MPQSDRSARFTKRAGIIMTGPIDLAIADGVAHLRFDCPDRLNVLDIEMAEAFLAATRTLLANPSVRVLLLSGAGRSLMAGGDVRGFHGEADKPAFIQATIDPLHSALKALAASDIITIVAAHGRVAGAGVSLVSGADLSICAADASFTLAYCRIAGVPDCGGSWALPRAIGLKQALAMALLNEPLGADDALRMGLVNKVVPPDELDGEARTMASRIAAGSRQSQGRTKKLMRNAFETPLDQQLDAEKAAFMECAAHPDFAEGVSAFLERRTPVFET
ncbi:enoyl-CoA hydratase [Zhengella mangrovi]|uniref:Enoyl-CoA hydratase n=2 Tax=Zhengella mangrovi TaxID=1982044 RepID=A0A2G1QQI5_9HYPH|nr:enoyl-CoA hydratase [Zhengella mangrovi]